MWRHISETFNESVKGMFVFVMYFSIARKYYICKTLMHSSRNISSDTNIFFFDFSIFFIFQFFESAKSSMHDVLKSSNVLLPNHSSNSYLYGVNCSCYMTKNMIMKPKHVSFFNTYVFRLLYSYKAVCFSLCQNFHIISTFSFKDFQILWWHIYATFHPTLLVGKRWDVICTIFITW